MKKEKPIRLKGFTRMLLENVETGKIDRYAEAENIITNWGFSNCIVQGIHGSLSAAASVIRYGALCTTTSAPATGDTDMAGSITRTSCTGSNVSSKTCQSTWSYATNEATASGIGSIGLYSTSTGSSLIAGAAVTPMTKSTNQTLSITYQLRFT